MQGLFNGTQPKLVLFDLDGTLVDSVPDLAAAIDKMLLAMHKAPAGVDKVRQWVGNGAATLVHRALANRLEGQETDTEIFERAYTLFLEYYGEQTAKLSCLYEGAEACLQGLAKQGVTLGLVTNKPIRFTRQMLMEFGLDDYFAVVLGGDSLAVKKPSPEPLLEAMKLCACLPEEALMVGDSKSDIGAARAAGCAVVCVPYGYNHGEDIAQYQPDEIVSSLSELV